MTQKKTFRWLLGGLFLPSLLTGVLLADNPTIAGFTSEYEKKYQYREKILQIFGIDVFEFKEKLKGGRADGHAITEYALDQILMGIEVESEHAEDKNLALEIAMDHLERFPDYYTRLTEMIKKAQKQPRP